MSDQDQPSSTAPDEPVPGPAPTEPAPTEQAPTEQAPTEQAPTEQGVTDPVPMDAPTRELPALDPAQRSALAPATVSPGRHAAPTRGHPRRWFLAGGLALVAGAAGGVVGQVLGRDSTRRPPPRPAVLLAAATAERTLIADLDATTGGSAAVRVVIAQVRADHAAHLRALESVLETYPASASSGSSASTAPSGTPRTRAELAAAEQRAATAGARRARTLDDEVATLLACVSACEATHAALLTATST